MTRTWGEGRRPLGGSLPAEGGGTAEIPERGRRVAAGVGVCVCWGRIVVEYTRGFKSTGPVII